MLGKNLGPGHLTTFGLVLEVDHRGENPFWGVPNITFLCVDDPYYGPVTGELTLDQEYDILHEQNSLEYNNTLVRLAQQLSGYIRDRADDVQVVFNFINVQDK